MTRSALSCLSIYIYIYIYIYTHTHTYTGHYRAFGSATFLDDKKRVVMPRGKPGDPNCKYEIKAGKGGDDKACDEGQWELLRYVCVYVCMHVSMSVKYEF